MIKKLAFFAFYFSSLHPSLFCENNSFDKNKWLTNSEYRYKVVRSSEFPSIEKMSNIEIIETLGIPDKINCAVFTYCLDINNTELNNDILNKNKCECSASYLIVDFDMPQKYRVTIVNVER